MLFHTYQFAVFFCIVFLLYLCLNKRWQNRMLLVASYVFYGAWDWRFLFLIFLSTVIDYNCGLKIYSSSSRSVKKSYLIASIASNLCLLGFFKYFNFFTQNIELVCSFLNIPFISPALKIILPVGISFYTFQTMSYTIDIYKGRFKPTTRFFDFALFVSFFPQLVAGPIERAKHLLPQVMNERTVTYRDIKEGAYLVYWGIFLKVFVADNLAIFVDRVFVPSEFYDGGTILISLYAFAFQIYCDFSGYSLMARGIAKCFGFDIMFNFRTPYFSKNPQEFWKRWHISLSAWLKDYVFIPLGGSRINTLNTLRNLFLVMVLGGLWHGASWTFICWGIYHGFLLIVHRGVKSLHVGSNTNSVKSVKKISAFLWDGLCIVIMFHAICFGWLLFRATSFVQIKLMVDALSRIFLTGFNSMHGYQIGYIGFFTWLMLFVEFNQWKSNDHLWLLRRSEFFKIIIFLIMYFSLIIFGFDYEKGFIYFQF